MFHQVMLNGRNNLMKEVLVCSGSQELNGRSKPMGTTEKERISEVLFREAGMWREQKEKTTVLVEKSVILW